MDQNPYRRRSSPIRTTTGGSKSVNFSELLPMKYLSSSKMKLTRTFTSCLILCSVLVAFSMIFNYHPSDSNRIMGFAEARVLDGGGFSNVTKIDSNDSDKLLGGL
ncbi:PREDICTED: galactoside 2-alpha-L-fucosyltransferase-like [Camelina sativa]|uniref:Galactoside 2-alpha-L-fucosyltransferase-like n=1 Tax=Camelina sativa TaxID=90675 RepID=A0ABM0Y638_CAMSA|nr:PREDICTED: galactoside 2-alpha-L-fucosyltransferase-like [Camelina sativa]